MPTLEQHDPEWVLPLTLFQAMQLASILGVRLHDPLNETPVPEQRIPLMERPDRIAARTEREEITVEQFGDSAAWELREFLESPAQMAAELPILFLRTIAAAVGINWLSLVPDENET